MKRKKRKMIAGVSLIVIVLLIVICCGLLFSLLGFLSIDVDLARFEQTFFMPKQNLSGGVMITNEIQLKMHPNVRDSIEQYWHENPGREYHMCIDGYTDFDQVSEDWRDGDPRMVLTSISHAVVGNHTYVSSGRCEGVAVIHSHPSSFCRDTLSMFDAEAAKWHFENGVSVYLIQCDEGRIEAYTRQNLLKGRIVRLSEV